MMPAMAGEDVAGGWYLYRFKAPAGTRCAVRGCQLVHPLYIGKTNRPWERVLEHAKTQPWWPAAGYDIDPQTYATEVEVLRAERDAILVELPLANEQHNGDNPHRLRFDGRRERTTYRPARRSRPSSSSPPARTRKPMSAKARRRIGKASGATALWLVLAGLAWQAANHLHVPPLVRVRDAAVAASLVLLAVWAQTRPRKAFSRRAARLTAIAGTGWLAWTLLPALDAATSAGSR